MEDGLYLLLKLFEGLWGGSHQSLGYLEKKEPMHRHQLQSPPRDRWYGTLQHNTFFFTPSLLLQLKVKFFPSLRNHVINVFYHNNNIP